ncbi:MAG TPA: hypothetical protein VLQ78_09200 [Ornithinibacter sp.]|nr:hypothetical protein [Ornithinibacter sp.]
MTRVVGGDVGGVRTADGPLTTTSYKAFLVRTEKSPAGTALAGLDWSAGGRVFTAEGAELPSATLGDRTVYVDTAAGEMGVVGPNGSAQVLLASARKGDAPPHLSTAVQEAGKPTVTSFAMVLPIGAGDISVDVAPGASLQSLESAPLLAGSGVAVFVTAESPDDVTPVVTRVAWTVDARRATWRDAG